MSKISSVLVTGGAGFIGSYVNKLLIEKGYHTIVLDNLSKGKREHIIGGDFIEGDIGEIELPPNIDAVLHFAALTDVGESVRDPVLYHENNVKKTVCLLEKMEKRGVKRFIFSSSAAVYGNPLQPYLTEEHPTSPINPYGETKRAIELELEKRGFQSISLRYFNAAGGDPEGRLLYRDPKPTNVIPILLRCLKDNRPFTVFGNDYDTPDGSCIRDYIHIHDLATAHLLALEALEQGHSGGIYNLGNGKGYSVFEVVKTIEKVTGKKIDLSIGPRRAGDPPYLVASAAKAEQMLGWKPLYSGLEEIVKDATKCYLP